MSGVLILQAGAEELATTIPLREYNRLLQLPRERELDGDLRARADAARAWYAAHGRPFVASRRVELERVTDDAEIRVTDGPVLHSLLLAQRLRAGEAHALQVVAASAGLEAASEIEQHWAQGRPDEAYFLDRFAVAITERLLFWASATLCRMSETAQETLLPHLSPGCGNWDLADQHRLWELLAGSADTLGPIRIHDTGALHPQHSVLAAMGVTRRTVSASPEQLCRSCDLSPCTFRRAPFSGEAIRPMIAVETR